jgi:methyltransferase-like protein 6
MEGSHIFICIDYFSLSGRYDEAQLRFKKGSKLGDDFYVRQDGTCAYFFELEQLKALCAQAGLRCEENEYILRQYANRQQKTARYRVWIHAKFTKL